jgi:hypothetical protein
MKKNRCETGFAFRCQYNEKFHSSGLGRFRKLQNPDGGFSWYKGYPSSYSTSLYILKNLGKINVWLKDNVKITKVQNKRIGSKPDQICR